MSDRITKAQAEPEYGKPFSDSDLLSYFWECFKESREYFDPIWSEYKDLSEMYYGETLSDKEKEYLSDTKRPPISFNYAKGTIDAVIGSDLADQKEAVFRGEEELDNVVGDWLSQIDRKIMKRCEGYPHENDAHFDQTIGGYGFNETFLDTSYYPMRLVTRRIPVWEAFPDPDSIEDNGTDCRYFVRARGWLVEEIQSRWQEKVKELDLKLRAGHIPLLGVGASVSGRWRRGTDLSRRGRVMVYDFLYKRFVPKAVWVDPETNETKNTTVEERDARQKELDKQYQMVLEQYNAQLEQILASADPNSPAEGPPIDAMGNPLQMPPPPPPQPLIEDQYTYPGHCWYRAYILGSEGKPGKGLILEQAKLEIHSCPTKTLTGYAFKDCTEGRVRRFGLMRVLHDAQLYLNRTLQVYLATLARGSKGGGDIEESALLPGQDPQKFIKERSIPGVWQIVADEANAQGKIKDRPVQPPPTGMEHFYQTCVGAFSGLSGVTDWVKGTATTERSNVLISNLQNQSMVMLNPLIDPLTRFRQANAQTRMEILLKHVSAEQIDKLLGQVDEKVTKGILWDDTNPETGEPNLDPQTGQPVPYQFPGADGAPLTVGSFLKQMVDPFDFDVVIDVGSSSPTSRERVWRVFEQGVLKAILEACQAAGVDIKPLVSVLVKNLPLPGSQTKELSDAMEAGIAEQKAMETSEGIVQAAINQGPEVTGQIIQQLIEAMNQQGQQPGQAPPPVQ